ncbi:hypothetical protein Acr_15g0011860 [Actinidia rufa]|uniref:Disease resistance N-terminal domain-containing protein n=1 Tax=Actinidia rufa TaxID=165716 RepID=A0A7J0FXD9_9ERIC|nr:hypothetical protein Acr_15g0011860 [Actinidia rufa]
MAIGEIFLAASITLLFDKLASGELWKFARREGIHTELEKWRRMLGEIEAVLADAEEKQITETGIQMWLEYLEDLAYDLDDVIDEIATEALRRKLMHQEPPASTSKAVENVGLEFYGLGCSNPFPSLEILSFLDFPEWKDWSPFGVDAKAQVFARLSKLSIQSCPKFLALTCLCPGAGLPSTLKDLFISYCGKLEAVLAEGVTINCPSLESIDIRACDNLKTLPDVIQNQDLRNLNTLAIEESDNLESLPEAYNKNSSLTSLRELIILGSLAAADIASYVLKEGSSLASLTKLTISNIDKPPSDWGLHRTRAAYLAFETANPWLPQPRIHCRARAASLAFDTVDLGLPHPRIISEARAASLSFGIGHVWMTDIGTAMWKGKRPHSSHSLPTWQILTHNQKLDI